MLKDKDMLSRVKRAIKRTYQSIADDAFGIDVVPKLNVLVETVLDCTHLETFGGDDEAIAEFRKSSSMKQVVFAKSCFRS